MRRFSSSIKSGSWTLRLAGLAGFLALLCAPAMAGSNYILEVKGSSLQPVMSSYGLTLQRQLFSSPLLTVGVVSAPDNAPASLASTVAQDPSVQKFQQDRHLVAKAPAVPTLNQGLSNTQAWLLSMQNAQQKTNSYLTQSALGIVGSSTGNKGAGVTVAVIDTAVDPTHPVFANTKLLAGVDCVGSTVANSCAGPIGNVWNDPAVLAALDQSTVIILDQSTVIILDQSTVIILDQSTVIILDSNSATALQGKQLPGDFGHGTMVASLIGAAAPNAQILPIRAFQADGSAQVSDIVAAVYYAVNNGAKIINMSFDLNVIDPSLSDAIAYATAQGVICVASTTNDGSNATVYPAAYNSPTQNVLGVGSVDSQTGLFRSSFSGYGAPSVDVYAPGENLIAAYPGNHFAVASGTSFSTALASGVAAVVESSKNSNLTNYVSAMTNSGSPVLFPYDGSKVVNAKSAIKSIQ
ncbi:MAG: S8 family serine peptidase [Bryobacteraceae bacterium]|nr:S8 family serine peptidase [Bryobacteraceae bacterium]